jgi:hypothetical protein
MSFELQRVIADLVARVTALEKANEPKQAEPEPKRKTIKLKDAPNA